jgi:hypothetical protein
LLVILLLCPAAGAQDIIELTVINPGARSLGFGGAFVALADDATASYANPAGLMQLVRPEISFEGRGWSDDPEGAASNVSGLGFASFVLPLRRLSLAVYGQTLTSLEFPGGQIGETTVLISDLMVVNAGFSVGWKVGESLSLGLGLTYLVGTFNFLGTSIDPINPLYVVDDVSTQSGFNAGVLWDLSDSWALGLAHRSGTDFDFGLSAQAEGKVRVTLPDVTAIGVRWRSTGGRTTVTAEVERLAGTEDRTRLHLGGELAFLKARPVIGLRAGVWRDPGSAARTSLAQGLAPSEETTHTAAGVGFAFKRFQLDFGADFSSATTTYSVSGIVTF